MGQRNNCCHRLQGEVKYLTSISYAILAGRCVVTTASKFGPLQWAIVVLVVFTAAVHIWLGISIPDTVFLLNGLGYLGLLGLLYLPLALLTPYRNIVRWVLIAYAAVTIFAWWFLDDQKSMPLAYITKASEVALIAFLSLENYDNGCRNSASERGGCLGVG